MAWLDSLPLIVTAAMEALGVCLLSLEVWIGHTVEENESELSPLQRLQFLYAAGDYRGFVTEVNLQRHIAPDDVAAAVGLFTANELKNLVDAEWKTAWPDLSRGLRRYERYTAPSARRLRRISLLTGTILILLATWLTFLREHNAPGEHAAHVDSASAPPVPILSLTRYQLDSFPSGSDEYRGERASSLSANKLCAVREAAVPAGPNVAVVIGHHDPVPLTAHARKRFGSNLGLAQHRAEAIARLLRDPYACPQSPAMEAIAVSVPNDTPLAARTRSSPMLSEQRRPDMFSLKIIPGPQPSPGR
jgi:hypothetical protein